MIASGIAIVHGPELQWARTNSSSGISTRRRSLIVPSNLLTYYPWSPLADGVYRFIRTY